MTTYDPDTDVNVRWRGVNLSRPTPEAWPNITELTTGPALDKVPPGFTAWAVGRWDDDPARRRKSTRHPDDPGVLAHIVVMPTLVPEAPVSIRVRYLARAVAVATAKCPLCSGRAHLSRRPTPTIHLRHSVGCPADDWTADEQRWFVPFRTAPERTAS
jgi:hypothetical protein